MKYQQKLNEKYTPFLNCTSSFGGTSFIKHAATNSFREHQQKAFIALSSF